MQAALALSPGDAVKAAYSADPMGEEARRYTGFATEALTIAVFEILIAGTLGTLLIRFFAPLLLEKVQHCFLSTACAVCLRRACRSMQSAKCLRCDAWLHCQCWCTTSPVSCGGVDIVCMSLTGSCLLHSLAALFP